MTISAHRLASGCLEAGEQAAFYSRLKMRNGTFKMTSPGRLSGLDEALEPWLVAPIRDVLDIGVSTGLTTLDLQKFLARHGHSPKMVGTDLFVHAHLVQVAGVLTVLTDSAGYPLQYEFAGARLRAWTRRLDYLTLAAIPQAIARKIVQRVSRRLIRDGRSRPIKMQSPALAGTGIEIVENDIFALTPELVGRFDFIRAANILNHGYFVPEKLSTAISNIRLYCRGPGSLLLVARSSERRHDGALFQLGADGRFHVRARFGQGSEIEHLLLRPA
jgi:hypothetical protein